MQSQIISNHHISPAILDLIGEAKSKLTLVSPYVKPWGHLESALMEAVSKGVQIHLIFRADQVDEYKYSLEKLVRMGIQLSAVENLHAKIFLSDHAALITSMNLYDFSSANSEEIGISITDQSLLNQTRDFVKTLEHKAFPVKKSLVDKISDGIAFVSDVKRGLKNEGNCIRCGVTIEFNPDRPMCPKCYKSWSKYKNPDFTEKYCHDCGQPYKTSIARPQCKMCFSEMMRS